MDTTDDMDRLDSGMTAQELCIIQSLMDAWERFSLLPDASPENKGDFVRAIHMAQYCIMNRVVARDHPDFWRT